MFNNLRFNMDSPFWRALTKFTDILILNLLFVICSLPVITIGASYTALYYVMRKLVKNEEGEIAKSFFRAFKSNFRQATCIWIIMLVFGGMLVLSLYLTARLQMVLNYFLIAVSLLYIITLSYAFPILSQFNTGVMQCIRNALFMGIARLPFTILIVSLDLIPFILILINAEFLFIVPPFMLLIGFGRTAFCNCFLFNRVFARYIPAEEDE